MILPNWPAPNNVSGFTYFSADTPLQPMPRRLQQVHGSTVTEFPCLLPDPIVADAVITRLPKTVCSIRTADCLPILVTNTSGNEVAAIHAGWKGLLAGIIENTFAKMQSAPENCLSWIGPAICEKCFEVGPEVREAFIHKNPHFTVYFKKSATAAHKYFVSLPQIAEFILKDLRVLQVCNSNICTVEDLRCNSYRREKGTDQRMMTGIVFHAN